ncbi:MAG: hypothetical protein AAF614_10755 [Chloroflexota bacterium]
MKKYYLILSIVTMLFLAACSAEAIPENSEPSVPTPAQAEGAEPAVAPVNIVPEETVAPVIEEAYPAQPELITPPEDYPGFIENEPYPAGEEAAEGEPAMEEETMEMVWVRRPMGIQCEDSGTGDPKKGLQTAVESLAAAGVSAQQWEIVEMMVTAVCGSPTGTRYRVHIPLSDLSTATSLGWTAE